MVLPEMPAELNQMIDTSDCTGLISDRVTVRSCRKYVSGILRKPVDPDPGTGSVMSCKLLEIILSIIRRYPPD
ncbi:MAG TPA: hypothetical protein DDW43_04740 [Nitrosomonas sp.]|nr:hypothetical protein [Nitrosomonas sp.]